MTENKRTEISTLGEFGLINHLTQNLTARNDSTIKGVGDDCAVLNYKKKVLVTYLEIKDSLLLWSSKTTCPRL